MSNYEFSTKKHSFLQLAVLGILVFPNLISSGYSQREMDLLEKSKISRDTTMVQFVPLNKKEEIRIEVGFQEYLLSKKLEYNKDSSLEKIISYTQTEDKTVKNILNQLKIPSKNMEKDAQKILNFVHRGFVYLRERDGYYPKSPLETIIEGGGDCKDLAILTASLMKSADMDVIYINLPKRENVPNLPDAEGHLLLGVNGNFKGKFIEKDGKKYYFAETTGSSSISLKKKIGKWKIGEIYHTFEERINTAETYYIKENLSKNSQKDSYMGRDNFL